MSNVHYPPKSNKEKQCSALVYSDVCLALVPVEDLLAWFLRWPCRKWANAEKGLSFLTIQTTGE